MSHRSASSTRVRSFRPTLEVLEGRTLPATGIGNLLTSFAQSAVSDIASSTYLVVKVNADLLALRTFGDNFGIADQLANDMLALANAAQAYDFDVELLGDGIAIANGAGQLDRSTSNLLNDLYDSAHSLSTQLLNAAKQAFGDTYQAFLGLATGVNPNPAPIPVPTTPALPPPSTTGNYAIGYTDAPTASSQNGSGVTESVRASQSADSNGPLQVEIKYTCTDGTTGDTGIIPIQPGTANTVPLNIMPCPAGNVGTFTVFVDGQQVHQNQTTWTQ